MAIAVSGCSFAANQSPLDARSAPGGLDVRGATTLTPGDLAYGGRSWLNGPHDPSRGISERELDGYLKPGALASAEQPVAPTAPPEPKRVPAPALPPPPAIVISQEEVAAAEQQELALVREPKTSDADLERYADRERQSQNLQSYRGGDAVVIGTSTIILILLIVLLVVLLT